MGWSILLRQLQYISHWKSIEAIIDGTRQLGANQLSADFPLTKRFGLQPRLRVRAKGIGLNAIGVF